MNTDGTLDTTYNPNASSTVNALHLLPDDGVIAGGAFATVSGGAYSHLVKLFQQGSIDTRFSIPFTVGTAVFALHKDSEGNLLV